jgi:iron complex transport system substrate-binding protein
MARRMSLVLRCMLASALALAAAAARAEIRLVDDNGQTVVLAAPARRIVSLAPHVTELLFAAGAGERIVGTVEYSDHPEAAKRIPRVGGLLALDLERILALKPDVLVLWLHGSAQRQLDALRGLGLALYYDEPRSLAGIARSLRALGRLAGTEEAAERAAREFEARVAALRARYAHRAPVRVFYQVWQKPLMTVNGAHLISDVIRLCGGENVFAGERPLVPVLATEAVIAADPEAIGTGVFPGEIGDGLDEWRRWPRLAAAARGNLFAIPTELISRHAPRIVEGAALMCEALERARRNRGR